MSQHNTSFSRALFQALTLSAIAILLLPVWARAQPQEEPGRPEIYLIPDCRDCTSPSEMNLAASISSSSKKPFKVASSQLILMDAHGEILFTVENPYKMDGTEAVGRSISGVVATDLREKLAPLQTDSYKAVLKVNDLYSNVVRFNVRAKPEDFRYSDGPGCPGSLSIEPLVDIHGKALPKAFLAYFRNMSEDSVSLAGFSASSRVLTDGRKFRREVFMWGGIEGLASGESWGTVVRFASFVSEGRKPIPAGEHDIQYRFGGCLSNVIRIKVEERPSGANN